jgi:hypothetical protein
MATMAASNVRDVGPKDIQARNNSTTRIDLANIADVPYYVESNFKFDLFLTNISIK